VARIHIEAYGGHRFPGVNPFEAGGILPNVRQERRDYPLWFESGRLSALNQEIDEAVFDLRALFETAQSLPEDDLWRNRVVRELAEAVQLFDPDAADATLSAQAEAFRRRVRPLLEEGNPRTVPRVYAVGHAHMDHAWLWPIEETTRKLARTFANMARYSERYQEFVFLQSMPAQLEILAREYPAVFADVKTAYERGAWEPNGGMFVEADCTLPAGESLIRQFLYGRKVSRSLLGYEGNVMWLPDVFGYPGNLPQILRGCGMEYFVTSKINWNDTTRFPYDLFHWEGIDGTAVPTAFIPNGAEGYNGFISPTDNALSWRGIRHKDVQQSFVKPVGEGDGGGGPMREDLELARRLRDLHGTPRTEWRRVADALPQVFAEAHEVPRWRGELYLEYHRGTYTSQGRIKQLNRRCENALRLAEFLAARQALQALGEGEEHRRAQREELWKQLLVHQFHDILPGSSIERVNREARTVLEAVLEAAEAQIAAYLGEDVGGDRLVVNPLARERVEVAVLPEGDAVPAGDGAVPAEAGAEPGQELTGFDGEPLWMAALRVPAAGVYRLADCLEGAGGDETGGKGVAAEGVAGEAAFRVTEEGVETPFYRVRMDETGAIASLIDRETEREWSDGAMNTLVSAQDVPVRWDAWDIDVDYELSLREERRVLSTELLSVGDVAAVFRRRLRIGERSELLQDSIFYAHTRRIDFRTRIDWRERHRVLKAAFPTTVNPPQLRSGVQYGWIERPTHRNRDADRAMFEIPAHGYSALSEAGATVAVMAPEKYGYDVRDGRIRLTLLKSATAPDESAEEGYHEFTYSLFATPHSFEESGIGDEVYELLSPLAVRTGRLPAETAAFRAGVGNTPAAGGDAVPAELQADPGLVSIHGSAPGRVEGVQLDWIKPAEDGRGIILRVYESRGVSSGVRLRFGFPVAGVERTTLLEDPAGRETAQEGLPAVGDDGREVTLRLHRFEVATLRVQRG
jgi:alpha-mannosidase